MTGIYLQCEICKKTLGGEQVSSEPYGLKPYEHEKLRKEAKNLGWITDKNINSKSHYDLLDYCNDCIKKLNK